MYAEVKCRTNFSFLKGASHAEEYIEQAAKLDLKAIAITDDNGVYAIPKAYWRKKDFPSLKLLVGANLNIVEHPSLTLLAKNRKGYGLLCRLLTESHKNSQKAQIDKELFSLMVRDSLDLIVIPSENSNYFWLKKIFPKNMYLPLTFYLDGKDKKRIQKLVQIGASLSIPLVATNDVHYHVAERRNLQDILTSIREIKPLTQVGYGLFCNGERYLKTYFEMKKLYHKIPEALDNTLQVAGDCVFCPSELRYRYPSEWLPKGHTAQSYLEELVWQGAQKRYQGTPPLKVMAQIRTELGLIEKLNFPDYFLTVYDIVEFAQKKKILCQGRGSAANSVVCYCLGITAIDPVRMDLLFGRFISVERNEPPDIDVDFEHERREEVIQYIYEKYGRDRAAMVSAVVTYRSRSAFREVAKAFGVEVGTLSARKTEREFENLKKDPQVKCPKEQIEKYAAELKGFPRHLSIHSGGFTLSADPITEIVPVEPATMPGRTIIQWDKYDLDYLGLLKIDVLSLGMLSALRKTLDQVGLKLHELPAEDPKTYEMIQKADTVGVFQIESRAQMSMLGRLKPKTFYDLVIEVAIVRPGPISGGMVHPYLKRRQGLEQPKYFHPKLKEILGKTLGVPLFQEQIMKIAVDMAGFTPGESDHLRRAIGAWRSDGSIQKATARLSQGLRDKGLPEAYIQGLLEYIKGFSEYGFPESHAASFALLVYASSYLKCHYPAEFTAALINSQPMGFYRNHTLIDDAIRHGVKVLPIDPNKSEWDCTLENGAIRLGFRVVQGLAKKDALRLFEQRPYQNLPDFLKRNQLRSDVLHRLAMGDAFMTFGLDQRHSLWQILSYQVRESDGQLDLFSNQFVEALEKPIFNSLNQYESIQFDYGAFNLSLHGHPMQALRRVLNLPKITTQEVKTKKSGTTVTVAGLILVRQKPPTAKGMTFSTLEDESGFLDIAIKPDVYEKCREIFLNQCFILITGELQKDQNTTSVLVKKMSPIWNSESDATLTIEPVQFF